MDLWDQPPHWVDRLLSDELRRAHPLVLRRARMLAGLVVALSPVSILAALVHWRLHGDLALGRHLAMVAGSMLGLGIGLGILRLGTRVRLAPATSAPDRRCSERRRPRGIPGERTARA